MNHFDYRDGKLCCEGVSLEEIARAVGTPAYIYSTATLQRHYHVFEAAFAPRKPQIAYAVKASGNIAILRTLGRLGAGADTVSAGEIARALKAGIASSRIVFSGVGKTREELVFAVEAGVGQINVESPAEMDMLAGVATDLGARPAVAIRVNPDVGAGGHSKISTGGADAKFGVGVDQALAMYAKAHASPSLTPRGFAVHIGSQIKDLAPLEQAFRVLRSLAETARADGLPVHLLDLGGGLGVPYFNEPEPPAPSVYAALVNRVFAGFEGELAFEPGRLIAANAGVLLTRLIRTQPRADHDILVVDAAMNDLIRPAMYEAYHDIVPVREPAPDASRRAVDVVGPVCETGDTFTRNRPMPPLEAGDLLAFMTAGAYGAAMSSTYNARALAPEVLVNGDRFETVRRRWTIAEQLSLERLPDWL